MPSRTRYLHNYNWIVITIRDVGASVAGKASFTLLKSHEFAVTYIIGLAWSSILFFLIYFVWFCLILLTFGYTSRNISRISIIIVITANTIIIVSATYRARYKNEIGKN